ncbi:restriction endonuclease subunit S [Cohnella lubricantis]|uniref:Restriction endonuclease subunit S n=1 Tax=Cohnella lubricantis TaxID=2163172 RepID=A0A841T8M8_9BACL|nr:restriction endonuclease subunit S [Cohnella lubricantis]MBB6676365.1 restriction endonuclease subunit S [Cohnella lubricantis]MBP2118787.1 type I restriction enzyme S subunit [Cohnella lubricantis]
MRETYKVSDLITDGVLVIGDGYRAKNSELSGAGVPFARAGNIDGGFLFKGADCFPISTLNKVGEKISQVGDVVFTSKGTVGRFAYVDESVPQFVYSPQLCFWRSKNQEIIQSRYLYYWMQSKEFIFQMNAVKGQTDMADYVSLSDQRKMTITVPSIKVQSAISHILGSIDDKIELNRQMNETLDQMASTLYKHWFVDFGLFQDEEFVDSHIGLVPGGWKTTKLRELMDLAYGKALKAQDRKGGVYPVYGSSGLVGWHNENIADAPGIIVGRKGTIGTVYLSYLPFYPIDTTYYIKSKLTGINPVFYLYYLLRSLDLEHMNNDSAVPGLNRESVYNIDVLIPPTELLLKFENKIQSFHDQINNNNAENKQLTSLRDYLLPHLLSGEIDVKVAEEQVEEVFAGG